MYFPLHVHSHFSFQDGLNKPKDIVKRCAEAGLPGSAVTDHGNMSASVAFLNAMDAAELKSIIGCELYVCDDLLSKEGDLQHLCVLAKNKVGWHSLAKLTSISHRQENFYRKPRVDLDLLSQHANGNMIGFSGHLGSHVANAFFDNPRLAYKASTPSAVKALIAADGMDRAVRIAERLRDVFGKENFYLEIQLIDSELAASQVVGELVRELSKKTGIPCIGTPDAHYASRADAINQRVVLCNGLGGITLREIQGKMVRGEDVGMGSFFRSNNYHIPSPEEMIAVHTEAELKHTLQIADQCEAYSLNRQPIQAKYDVPGGISSEEYLRQLCREGWKEKLPFIKRVIAQRGITKQVYGDRVNKELDVLCGANLSDYFLIVRDIINFAKVDGQIVGPGRGSGAGSLVLYLLNVTQIDPIEFDLIFERFYNAGRNTGGRISMPDVDMDFETGGRGKIIEYMRDRFGRDKVAQIATFTRMQGRTALKDVLRTYGACSSDEMNKITEFIPDENEINDQLQLMKEADKEAGGDGDASIIDWALDNYPKELSEWCYKDDNGNLQGSMSKRFEQAIALEGTIRGTSKHAGGVVVADTPLEDVCPMLRDKSNPQYLCCGMPMGDIETVGLTKYDVLGVNALDKLHMIQDSVNDEQ
jgi:DNA polymerase-3 subunit alpha